MAKFISTLVVVFGLVVFSAQARADGPMCEDTAFKPSARMPASDSSDNEVGLKIIQADPDMPVDTLKNQGYDVITADQFEAADPWADPSPRLRDQVFQASGIRTFVRGWDHLKKDMLFLRAQEQPLDRLVVKYPTIPRALLANLQLVIDRAKGARK